MNTWDGFRFELLDICVEVHSAVKCIPHVFAIGHGVRTEVGFVWAVV